MRYLLLLFLTLGCQDKININAKVSGSSISEAQVAQVKIVDGKVELSGRKLSGVTLLRVMDGSQTHVFKIDSKTDSKIIASTVTNISFALNKAMNFIISDASASSSFIVDFSLCNSTLNGGRFDCSLTANDKDVLAYDALSGTWRPRAIRGINYKGVWNATGPLPTATDPGDYFIVSVDGNGYHVGDWTVFNGTSFEKIDNSQNILSVFGRTGAITAQEGDYSIAQLRDVTFSTPPATDQALVYNGASWGARSISSILNDTVPTFTGDKSFQGSVTAESGIKVGSVTSPCSSSTEGTLRYNSSTKKMEFCNSSSWSPVTTPSSVSATNVTITIGTPSSSLVSNGPVTLPVTYSSGTLDSSINLTAAHVFFTGAGSSGCAVTGITGSGLTRNVTIANCEGNGSVGILIAPGTATSTTGSTAPGSSPSTAYTVDSSGPVAVSSLSLGSVPSNLTSSPVITFPDSSDTGGSSVDHYEAKVVKTSDSSVVKDWTTVTSGSALTSLVLQEGTSYSIEVRAVDSLGNTGASSALTSWTSVTLNPCGSGAVPGASCTGGTYYVGELAGTKYMTTPGNCTIPNASKGSSYSYGTYPTGQFTPVCSSGTDSHAVSWDNNSYSTYYDVPEIVNYTTQAGTGYGNTNTDANSGSFNTAKIVEIADPNKGSNHAAALYCDRMNFGGYSDWFLPNRSELHLIQVSKDSIPGTYGADYWSSSEYSASEAWYERMSDGFQYKQNKSSPLYVRCVRKI